MLLSGKTSKVMAFSAYGTIYLFDSYYSVAVVT